MTGKIVVTQVDRDQLDFLVETAFTTLDPNLKGDALAAKVAEFATTKPCNYFRTAQYIADQSIRSPSNSCNTLQLYAERRDYAERRLNGKSE